VISCRVSAGERTEHHTSDFPLAKPARWLLDNL
jgi:hypothetical protein